MSPRSTHLALAAPLAFAVAFALTACGDRPPLTAPASAAPPRGPSAHLATVVTPAPITLSMRDLGDVQAHSFTNASINERGDAAGSFFTQQLLPATLRWESGQLTTSYANSTIPIGEIDDAGHVVGSETDYAGRQIPTAWLRGVPRHLELPTPNVDAGEVRGINNAGQAVGEVYTIFYGPGEGIHRAAVWDLASGAVRELGTLGGPAGATAADINGRGDVAANQYLAPRSARVAVSLRNGTVRPLGDLGGHTSEARAINEIGEIAGMATTADGSSRPFLWSPVTGAMLALGIGGNAWGAAADVNNRGQVVGIVDDGTRRHAVLWQDGEIFPLHDAATATEAFDVNDAGDVIGTVYDAATQSVHAVIWTVPLHPTIDVAPGDATNTIALGGKGIVTVAVLATPYFDASRVDPASLTLGDADANDTPVLLKRDGTPSVVFKDVDHDGDVDLVAQFDKDVLKQKGDLTSATTRLTLRGRLRDGRAMRASNAVTVSP
jgi:probable HAF family extracellular repeat protein